MEQERTERIFAMVKCSRKKIKKIRRNGYSNEHARYILVRRLTAIDILAAEIGPRFKKEFPTPEDLNSYLNKKRKEIFRKVYSDYK